MLTLRQRRELIAQLRGRTPLVPERLPLVRATADQLEKRDGASWPSPPRS